MREQRRPIGRRRILGPMGASVILLVRLLLVLLYLALVARVVLSWIAPRGRGTFERVVYQTTEPILGPIRRALPSTGMLDLSPLIALLLLSVVLAGLR